MNDVLALLRDGDLEIEGRLVDASNATLYAAITKGDLTAHCVYKPIRGERPLWDFPDGTLAYREVAAYEVSEATGWDVVPPTVLREGPLGEGMVQLWIDVDESIGLADLVRQDHPALRRMALFDAVVNNADRKGGHLLPVPSGHVYGVDHGVCFSDEPKLRTVLWGWRGRRLVPEERAVLVALLADLGNGLGETLRGLLAEHEVAATVRRVERLLSTNRFPHPSPDWPAVPWPPF
ncbi:MAG TPA: SCO1664 family protein [Frankiaceae bacterium]|nr:SCO1664 family protein [Frankiaceae bacterium]